MIDRIIEAFTRPHYQVTGVDEAIESLTVLAIFVIVAVIWIVVANILDK